MNELLMKEEEVENRIRDFLRSQGFIVERRTKPQGIDIIATSEDCERHFIEVEGNEKPDGRPFTTSQKYTHFLRAVGQICIRLTEYKGGVFAIGIPRDCYYLKEIDRVREAFRKLNILVYVVNEDHVKVIPPREL